MKKQLLTVALLLSTNVALPAEDGGIARINRGQLKEQAEMDKYLTAQFRRSNHRAPGINDTHTNIGIGGSSQTYKYEGNGKWKLVSWSHGLAVNSPKKEIQQLRHPAGWIPLTAAQEEEALNSVKEENEGLKSHRRMPSGFRYLTVEQEEEMEEANEIRNSALAESHD